MKHEINIDCYSNFVSRVQLAGSFGLGSNKELTMHTEVKTKQIWFEVTDHKTVIAKVPELQDAIDLYNEL